MKSQAVFFLVPSFASVSPIKAAEYMAINTSKNLYCDVFFVSIDDEIAPSCDSKENGIIYRSLNAKGWVRFLIARLRLKKMAAAYESCVVVSFLIRADILLLTIPDVTKISSVRNMVDEEYCAQYPTFLGFLFGFIHFWTLKKFDCVVVMSNAMLQHFRAKRFDMARVELICNFLNESAIDQSVKSKIQNTFEKTRPLVLTASSLIRRKNVAEIINVAMFLMDDGYDFDLIILGDGELRQDLEGSIPSKHVNNVHFLGHLPNPLPFFNLADCFVMASFSEGVSRSLMEALYLEVPVVVRRIPGNDELVVDGKNGYLFTDSSELKEGMRRILEDGCLPNVMLPWCFREKVCMSSFISLLKKFINE